MAQLLAPDLCPTVPLRIVIDDQGNTRQMPVSNATDATGSAGGAANVQVCLALDRSRLIVLYMQRMLH